jgi:hypothetical protein
MSRRSKTQQMAKRINYEHCTIHSTYSILLYVCTYKSIGLKTKKLCFEKCLYIHYVFMYICIYGSDHVLVPIVSSAREVPYRAKHSLSMLGEARTAARTRFT